MDKLGKLIMGAGIGCGIFLTLVAVAVLTVPATAVDGPGVIGASVDDKYAGLTQEQVTYVKIWKEMCDNRAENASYTSKTLGEVQAAKCVKGETDGIAKYVEQNIRTNKTLDR